MEDRQLALIVTECNGMDRLLRAIFRAKQLIKRTAVQKFDVLIIGSGLAGQSAANHENIEMMHHGTFLFTGCRTISRAFG